MERNFIGKKDLLFAALLLAAAAAAYFVINAFSASSDEVYAEIWYDNSPIMEVSLDKDKTFNIPQVPEMEFEVKEGKIAVIHSDCPDKICINAGYMGKVGQTAVCLPNKTSVRIVSQKNNKNQPDAVV